MPTYKITSIFNKKPLYKSFIRTKKPPLAVACGGNEGCYLLLVGVSMKNQFGIIGMKTC